MVFLVLGVVWVLGIVLTVLEVILVVMGWFWLSWGSFLVAPGVSLGIL